MRKKFVFDFSYVVQFRNHSASKFKCRWDRKSWPNVWLLTPVKIMGGVGEWGEIAESRFRATPIRRT